MKTAKSIRRKTILLADTALLETIRIFCTLLTLAAVLICGLQMLATLVAHVASRQLVDTAAASIARLRTIATPARQAAPEVAWNENSVMAL